MKIFICLCLCFCSVMVRSATFTAASAKYEDVKSAIALAVMDDTVVIPAGTGYWTNYMSLNKPITLQGSGTNSTFINSAYTAGSTGPIYMNATNTSHLLRVTGIAFGVSSTNAGASYINGYLSVNALGMNNRVDHNLFTFSSTMRSMGFVDASTYGTNGGCLFDNNKCVMNGASGVFIQATSAGHVGMSKPSLFGTTNMGWFMENNWFTNSSMRAITDGRAGQNLVFRFNRCDNVAVENHEFGGTSKRGMRCFEVYSNSFMAYTGSSAAFLMRSATMLACSNNINGIYSIGCLLVYYRASDVFSPYGQAMGTNSFDLNYGVTYASGTHTGAAGSQVLTDSTASWTVNQWLGYSIKDVTTGKNGLVSANTATTLTCIAPVTASNRPVWGAGDTYNIFRVDRGLDAPGMGQGDLLTGVSGSVPPTPTTWPHQLDEPIHWWANTGAHNSIDNTSGIFSVIVNGRNYTNTAPSGWIPAPYPHPLATGTAFIPPTISNISSQTTTQDMATAAIAFTLGSGQTNVASYTMSTASSLTTLVPNSGTNYVFGGSGASRNVTIYPIAGQYGSTTITLTVTDETGAQAATAFMLTVSQAAATPPTISVIADASTTVNHASAALTFTIGDAATPVANLILSGQSANPAMVPQNNFNFGGTGSNKTVTVFPILDGVTTGTVTVQNASGLTASTNFTITAAGNSGQSPIRYQHVRNRF